MNSSEKKPDDWLYKLKKITFKTRIVDVSKKFLEYLIKEDINIDKNAMIKNRNPKLVDMDELHKTDEYSETNQKLASILQEFDGKCFVKIENASARDMHSWVDQLRCQFIQDIHLSLKFSDIISDKLESIRSNIKDYTTLSNNDKVSY